MQLTRLYSDCFADSRTLLRAIGAAHFLKQLGLSVLLVMGFFVANTAHANPICTVIAIGPNAIYDPLGASHVDAVGNIEVRCTYVGLGVATPAYQIQLSAGSSNSYNNRTMRFLGNVLIYNLFVNASRSLVWGDGTGGTSRVSDSFSMGVGTTSRNYPIYMRVAAAQMVNAGTYADAITVTVNY